ncbi:ATP-binding cassette, subfamily B, MsbA [Haloferax larsenii]|uniref:ATP-binding cassette, subfamily B, MsbA n=2 Tax=Haloferax larsenii TaxID=302484 RepID=A0A1H7V019_HALLR|nr:ATP-binding cassette, subfamily B, MsbA [Haloferax larsenii]
MEYLILAVAFVMTIRFSASFLVSWLKASIRIKYVAFLRDSAFNSALHARTSYYDSEGSDDILNSIITESKYAGRVIEYLIRVFERAALAAMYLLIALYLAPKLAIGTAVALGLSVFVVRMAIEPGYDVGERVADANQGLQSAVQAGTQGIRDVKLFGLTGEVYDEFGADLEKYVQSTIKLLRNQAAIQNAYQWIASVSVFALIYFALTYTSLTLGSLGVFLFAIFRLAPTFSSLNNYVYKAEGDLPHLIRMQNFIIELRDKKEEGQNNYEDSPETVGKLSFNDVEFSYEPDETVLDGISFSIDKGDLVAFVGPSGAGKSTIASLAARMYEPDSGQIIANETDISEIPIQDWRQKIAVVRQNPYIFNDTLEKNVTIGKREATKEEVRKVCEVSKVDEYVDDLPNGYDTVLGENGVKISGGQKQRIAIARALLTDSELLILDEATSDLDTELESEVHAGIEEMNQDQTMLVIAHRLSTVTNADVIYTLESGKIAEKGTHDELVNRETRYADLYEMQLVSQ